MFERERRMPEEGGRGALKVEQDEQPVHSQVRRIKQDEEARELLLRLQLL